MAKRKKSTSNRKRPAKAAKPKDTETQHLIVMMKPGGASTARGFDAPNKRNR